MLTGEAKRTNKPKKLPDDSHTFNKNDDSKLGTQPGSASGVLYACAQIGPTKVF